MSDSRLQSGKIQGGHETLTRIINDLRSKEERIRLKAANNLHQYISSESREISGEAFTKFMEGVSRRIFELVSSSDINEKMGGILAIDKMIDIDFEESATKITRFANYLRPVFPNNDATLMVMASKVLGHLAHAAGTLTADFVEFELKRALEWLQSERNEAKRHASVLILKELAENSGILFYTYIEQFLESIWPSLRDPKLTIREAAVDALRACFSLIALRDTPQRAAWYRKIFEEAQRGIEKANVDSVHGSLLAIGELIRNSSDFMVSHFRDMCDLILRHREHRDRLIKRTVIVLLPRLAEFSVAHNHVREVKSAFQESLDIAMQLLFKALSKDGDRSFAYISLAEMISAMQQFNAQYLDEIIARIKDGLANKTKKTYFVEAVSCVSVLARAVKDQLKPHAVGLLDNLGYTPLSQSLIDAMSDMALYIPDLLSDIQSRLIQRFKTILSALSSRQLVSPQQRRLTVGALSSPLAQANLLDMVDTDSIILAIKTLGTFNFRGHMLIDFARDVVLSYTDDDNPLIRKEAALTCSKLLSSPDQSAPTKGQAAIVIGEVLAKLLTVAISDPDPSIRSTIFSSFDPRLDHHLAQPENLNSLFIALNDEVFEIRGLAISLMGRLALRNPAFVMPTLRKTLIQLMTELEYSGDLRNKEESAQLLACLIRSSHRLTKPYMEPVLKAIVPKLREGSQGLSIWILDVLGALAEVSGEEMCAYFDELMPMVMEAMQDQSSGHKREVALTTLRQLVLSTGKAITPYTKYPQLLNILLQMLKTELSGPIRTEVLKVLGTLGAFDPYRHKVNQLDTQGRANHVHVHSHKQDEIDSTLDLLPGMGSSSEEYCPTVAISALMRILRDPSLSIHHTSVIQAVMYIFKNLGTKSVPFLPYVMPPFLQVMRTCEAQFREYLFTQLGQLVGIVKQHIKKYLDDIFALIHENWLGLINHILPLVEGISLALNDEFKVYLPDLIPMMLNVLHTDRSERRSATQKVLHAFEVFGANLDDYLHLVIPAVVRLFEQVDAPVNVRLNAIQTLAKLSRKLDFSDYASRIIHPLARVLDVTYHELRREAMETFCVLVYQLGPDYAIFAPKVNKVLAKQRIQHARYEQLVSKLLKNQRLPQDGMEFDDRSDLRGVDDSPLADSLNTKKLNVHQANLKKTWEVTQCSNKEDWIDWSRRFALELLRESSSPALRACSALAQVYPTLSRELFNAGFVSCWTELHEANQDSLVTSLESALKSSTIPPEILQVLLNLAEFMEHDDKPLPIDIKTLGTLAEKCHAYAKALHYKEIEFHSSPNTLSETIEALISINNQLQQPEAADGILKYAESTMERVSLIKESWYEKLHRWRDALEAYGRRQLEDPQSAAVAMGMMRCYNALGEWDPLAELTETHWALVDDEQRRTIAPLAASAAWNLGAWDHLEKYVLAIDEKSIDGCFFRAILSLHLGEYERAQLFIDSARVKLDTELTALIGESYDRAYNQVVKVQQLTELEEMILYKRSSSLPEMQYTIRKLWNERLAGCQRNVEFWQQLLGIRSLVLEPHESIDMHIKFASLCRKSGRLSMSSKSLMKLLGGDSTNLPPNRVGYAYIKHMWDAGAKDVAIDKLKVFVQHSEDDTKLRARCHLLLGRWQQAQDDGFQESTVTEIMHHYRMATEYDSAWYKAWHAWALSNFEVANHHFKNHVTPEKFSAYVVSAVQGFFRSIALGPGGSSSLQDTLRLLTLWFQFGSFKDVEDALKDGFPTVSIDTWLQVIPQLIARIHSGAAPVRRLVHDLLSTVGKEHPQALIYPLTVASKSQAESRKNAALDILNKMRQHSAVLVEQAVLVSQELIRVAIIWHEMWHEGLEEASRLYFGDHNVEGMFDILKPLHEMMDRGPETMREVAFQQAYGRDLQEALEWCKKYQRSEKIIDLNQAWDMYYQVFRRINKQLPQLTSLDLQYVSPRLQECQNLDLAVPGTYKVGEDVVKIRAFSQTLSVITSKQRPRKLNIHGSDGNDYHFLLKGHEDLRQDERVMQLFGLVNTLLATNPETAKTHLSIRRYSVIPLAPNSGLIGWVPNCDTLHALIRDYRESRKILLNIEHRLMLQMAPDFENLSLIQKVEVFEYALENTTGQDLYKVLWLKSKNSEAWLDRRTNYTRSLAVMSMVGYILGLGDRHPSNLMMDRRSGKILHIDFGDCFEVAMVREKFPEKIPFRLTRMLIQAMEVSGIEGNYRSTCERVMAVLRENKESLMAVLEAFVHDPLINWRLLTTSPKQDKARGRKSDDDIEDEQPTILSPQQHRNRELSVSIANDEAEYPRLNERALAVVERVQNKLTGKDFASEAVDVPQQVQLLIQQATSHENLCQCYIGWCPFW